MAYGFNNDKSKAVVLTAGEIKKKYVSLSMLNDTVSIGPGDRVEFTFQVSNTIDLSKVIGVVGFTFNTNEKTVIVTGLTMSSEFGRIYLSFLNIGTTTVRFTGYGGLYMTYIDQ